MSTTDNNKPEAKLTAKVTVNNARGLHARAAAKFVNCVARFDVEVQVACHGQEVSGASIMGLLMFSAGPGTVLEISVQGTQLQHKQALEALQKLVKEGFGERDVL